MAALAPANRPGLEELDAYWALSEDQRHSFTKGRHAGRAVATTLLLSALAAPAALATLPVWGMWSLGAIGISVLLSNTIGFLMDADKGSDVLGKIAVEKPALKDTKHGLFKEGIKTGLLQPLKKLPLAIIGTPFWPVLLVIGPLVNKGTAGYYFFKPNRKQAEAERKKNQQPFACNQNITQMPSEIAGKFNAPKPRSAEPPKDWTPPNWPHNPKP